MKNTVVKTKWELAYRGEQCQCCAHPATAVNKDGICKKCFNKYQQ